MIQQLNFFKHCLIFLMLTSTLCGCDRQKTPDTKTKSLTLAKMKTDHRALPKGCLRLDITKDAVWIDATQWASGPKWIQKDQKWAKRQRIVQRKSLSFETKPVTHIKVLSDVLQQARRLHPTEDNGQILCVHVDKSVTYDFFSSILYSAGQGEWLHFVMAVDKGQGKLGGIAYLAPKFGRKKEKLLIEADKTCELCEFGKTDTQPDCLSTIVTFQKKGVVVTGSNFNRRVAVGFGVQDSNDTTGPQTLDSGAVMLLEKGICPSLPTFEPQALTTFIKRVNKKRPICQATIVAMKQRPWQDLVRGIEAVAEAGIHHIGFSFAMDSAPETCAQYTIVP